MLLSVLANCAVLSLSVVSFALSVLLVPLRTSVQVVGNILIGDVSEV